MLNLFLLPFEISFTTVKGSKPNQRHEILLFTISTCQWCHKGKRWLNERGYTYKYVDIDQIPIEHKRKLKKLLKETFGYRPNYPFIVVDKKRDYAGYNTKKWEELLK